MATVSEVMAELEAKGSESIKSESIKKIMLKHGIKEPFFGVKIEYLKDIKKRVKTDYELAKGLFATGNADAQYLAGLITDDAKMTKADLQLWAENALSDNINEYIVPWVAAESQHVYKMALEWIENIDDRIVTAGWSTLANLVSLKPDSELDIPALKALLGRVEATITSSANRVIYVMNNYVICIGTYVSALTDNALAAAARIRTVIVDMNGTACKVPSATDYIKKAESKGTIGKKKKTVKC